MEDAWYARHGGKVGELYTILHLSYTSMVLSYVLIGADLSPTLFVDRLALTIMAYFLGLGISAHARSQRSTPITKLLSSSLFTKSNAISPVPVATSSTRAFASRLDTSRTACLHVESFRNVRRESKVSYSLGAPLNSLCTYYAFSCTEYHLT